MTAEKSATGTLPSPTDPPSPPAAAIERRVVLSRLFEAPRELVYRMWTEPEHMARWWGPACFTNPVCELDVRPGGALRIVMRAPDGTEYPMVGTFREVVPPERLVLLTFALDGEENPLLENLISVTFAEEGERTKLTVEAEAVGFVPIAAQMLAGMEEGLSQSLVRLAELLPAATADREIAMTRVFDAPRELVFAAWTDPHHVAQWWGPDGFTNTIDEMDVRPGGTWRFVMHGPDGTDYKNESIYDEVVKPERLVYNHISAPRFQMTATFEPAGGADDAGEKTRLTVRMRFETAALRDQVALKFGAVEGLGQTLGRLAGYLPQMGER